MRARGEQRNGHAQDLVELFLRFLEPAALGDALFMGCSLSRSRLRLIAREGDDHDGDCKDGKKADQHQERESREQEKRPFGLGAHLLAMSPPETVLACERADIMLSFGPGRSRRGTRDVLLLLHGPLGAPHSRRMQ